MGHTNSAPPKQQAIERLRQARAARKAYLENQDEALQRRYRLIKAGFAGIGAATLLVLAMLALVVSLQNTTADIETASTVDPFVTVYTFSPAGEDSQAPVAFGAAIKPDDPSSQLISDWFFAASARPVEKAHPPRIVEASPTSLSDNQDLMTMLTQAKATERWPDQQPEPLIAALDSDLAQYFGAGFAEYIVHPELVRD